MTLKKPLVLTPEGDIQQIQTGDFVGIAQGGTGAGTAVDALTALGAYPAANPNNYISVAGAPVQSVSGKTGVVTLTQNDITNLTTGSTPTFAGVNAVTFTGTLAGNASSATLAYNINGGIPGALPYQSAANTTGFSAAGTTGQIVLSGGVGAPTFINQNAITLQSSQITAALGFTPVNVTALGANNGVATLDSAGKLTLTQIPDSLVGAMQYQGVWNANTNTPAITSAVGTKGQYYKVSVAGATSIDGQAQWSVGDLIVFDGSAWDKIEGGSTEVTSVAGRVGAVVLAQADISGLTSASTPTFAGVNATTFTGALAGNAATATKLATVRTINGVNFDGTANITVAAAAGTLTGNTLAAGVTTSSLTTVGNVTAGTWSANLGAISGANLTNLTAANLTGTIPSAVLGASSYYLGTTQIALNRASGAIALTGITSIDGNAASASAVPASGVTGTTLAANVVNSSLTGVGIVTVGTWSGNFGAVSGANLTNLTAGNISGQVAISQGGTGASTAAAAATALGVGTTNTPTFAGVAAPNVVSLTNNQGSSVPIGSAVYDDGAGTFALAKADANTTSRILGLANGTIASAAAGNVAVCGPVTATLPQWNAITGGTTGLTPNAKYYLSNATAGALTTVPPTTGYVVCVGRALTANILNVSIGVRIQL